jgi:hypothetical protein
VWIPFYGNQRSKTPRLDLKEEIKRLVVALSSKDPKNQEEMLAQIKQVVAGTHFAVPIQAPEVKTKTKGRPEAKKDCSTSTKQNPSAFEHVKKGLKHPNKQPSKGPGRKSTKRMKKQVKDDSDSDHEDQEESFPEDSNDLESAELDDTHDIDKLKV